MYFLIILKCIFRKKKKTFPRGKRYEEKQTSLKIWFFGATQKIINN